MKATDLRIGNYVWNKATERVQLKEIYSDCSVYDPIPLTEDWLIKLGIKIIKEELDFGRYYYENEVGKYKDSKYFEYVISSEDDSYGGWSYHTIEIEYVHQLQNLFWCLTGSELELKDSTEVSK